MRMKRMNRKGKWRIAMKVDVSFLLLGLLSFVANTFLVFVIYYLVR